MKVEEALEGFLDQVPSSEDVDRLTSYINTATLKLNTATESIGKLNLESIAHFANEHKEKLGFIEEIGSINIQSTLDDLLNDSLKSADIYKFAKSLEEHSSAQIIPSKVREIFTMKMATDDGESSSLIAMQSLLSFSGDWVKELGEVLDRTTFKEPESIFEDIISEVEATFEELVDELVTALTDIAPEQLQELFELGFDAIENVGSTADDLFSGIESGVGEVEDVLEQINSLVSAIEPAVEAFKAIP